jgi:hypothetical protein
MRFSRSDWIVSILTGVLSLLFLYLFFSDLNAVSGRGNEPALGTIFFKKQTATRKSSDSQMWERLRNQSPVYRLDTLRTDEDSEAVVNFDDGLSLDMLQNSMLKLTVRGQSANLDFQEGSITLRGGDKSAPVFLGQSGSAVALSPDAQLVVTKTKDTTSLELSQGSASVSDRYGKQQTLTPETAMDFSDQTGSSTLRPVNLIPRYPEQGSRLLTLETGKIAVKFGCQTSRLGSTAIEIELSPAADFSTVAAYPATREATTEKNGNLYTAEIPLDSGTWYWRVAAGEIHSSVRQLSIDREEALTLIQPPEGGDISYRKKEPPVRFSWTASEHVAYWDIELARGQPDFKTPALRRRTTVSSLSLAGLTAGSWFWRVIPHYSGTLLADQKPMVGHFTVTQRPAMTALEPTIPVEGSLVQTQELSTKGLAFTWDPPAEAKRYELSAYTSLVPGTPPSARFETSSPYKIITPQELGTLAAAGRSFWVLRWYDEEGNASPQGAARSLIAVDGALAIRPTFPPDGYKVADQFVTNTRFSWKSTLSVRTVFQVSRTPEFKDIVWEAPVKAETALGSNWGTGTYYWRLSCYNANGSVFIQTPPRRLEVMEPFPAVRLTQPQPGAVFLLPEYQDQTVIWPATKDADYYQLTLFAVSAGNTNFARASYQASVEQTAGETVSFKLPLSEFPEGSYVVRIQAFAREKLMSTSVIGLYGDSPFAFKRLMFIKLLAPTDGSRIDGLTARRSGLSLEWETANLPPNATVKLSSLPDGAEVSRTPVTEVAPLKIPRLNAGEYSWTVQGSIEGFDVSARRPNRFTVLAIPKLPAAMALEPADKSVYGPKELRKLKGIEFSWQPVPQAEEYLFSLYPDTGSLMDKTPPILQIRSAGPKVTLEKLGILHKGGYVWEVRAQTLDPTGETERDGIPAWASFVIDLPVLEAPKLPTGQAYYGR